MAFADDAPVYLLKSKSKQRPAGQWLKIGHHKKFYRSTWEENYARYLEWLKVNKQIKSWAHEPKTFWFLKIKRGVRSYKPDFKVVFDNRIEWHEVKGWMDSRSATKIKRMEKYYPKETIVLIDAAWFKNNSPMFSVIIPGWEKNKNV